MTKSDSSEMFPGIKPMENPNRCMSCLVKARGTPKRHYVPASDSAFFDTSLCGDCGQIAQVCDGELLDAYADCGLHLSDPALFHPSLKAQDRQPIKLRLKLHQLLVNRRSILREVVSFEEAVAHLMQRVLGKPSTSHASDLRLVPASADEDLRTVLEDPTTSFWLSSTLEHLITRDPADALHDLEVAERLMAKKLDEAHL